MLYGLILSLIAALSPGWNLITGTGQDVGAFTAENACVGVLWRYDAATQEWFGHFPEAPAHSDTAFGETLTEGTAYWAWCTRTFVPGVAADGSACRSTGENDAVCRPIGPIARD